YDPTDPADAHVLMPEYLTCEDKSRRLAEHVVEWLTDARAYEARVRELESLKATVAHGGASKRAADYLLQELTPGDSGRSAA
ncbi:MAG: hypothetical protein AAF589_01120, partial [Planctomycetota bacterium]